MQIVCVTWTMGVMQQHQSLEQGAAVLLEKQKSLSSVLMRCLKEKTGISWKVLRKFWKAI